MNLKYYKNSNGEVFNVVNGKSVKQTGFEFPTEDSSAKQYYLDSIKMREYIEKYLKDLRVSDAVDSERKKIHK